VKPGEKLQQSFDSYEVAVYNSIENNFIKPLQGFRSEDSVATPGFTGGYSHIATSVAMII
jgi:hypothetical protein